ncbi:MAG: DUF4191 family protein [Actinobacteria bacterium]|uniref:Unannotated protein n=1 Tax=freshwater metagenome TaxID=449393 RepID=A0A6J7FC61_9ZZZZ|nr:DUF4191 family protein [Actinomycetota bacterium]
MFKRMRKSLSTIAQNWGMTQKVHRLLGLEILGFFLAGAVVVGVPVAIFINLLTAILIAIPAGLVASVYWFSRRAMSAAYSQIEGQPGAAAAVAQQMRGGWQTTPGVAVNKNQDLISRVVGKPGVILISEGASSRVVPMLAAERKKTARWVPDVPIYEIQIGNEEGQITLAKLQRALNKLPRNLRGSEITEMRRRLDAVSAVGGGMPIPKGPMPTSSRSVRRQRGA